MADDPRFEPLVALKELRGPVTLESLSADTGISVSQISRYENGERSPSLSHLRALSERLRVPVADVIGDPSPKAVPVVSWVSAGRLKASHPVYDTDILRVVHVSDLPSGSWMALEIDGDSMDRIAPPGSIIVLDRNDKVLVDGRFYVFGNSSGEATFKRYRARPERLQPFSTNPDHETHYLEDTMECVGRVRQVLNYV
ncbi:XRE family transcriptional regulator [Methylorubrum thiocyanatum]|uniref:XRE family transcriptional regulator n=1 Tax=Methylorubrum thiocyanatum TaxID=47958 RepID=UPI0035C7D3A4